MPFALVKGAILRCEGEVIFPIAHCVIMGRPGVIYRDRLDTAIALWRQKRRPISGAIRNPLSNDSPWSSPSNPCRPSRALFILASMDEEGLAKLAFGKDIRRGSARYRVLIRLHLVLIKMKAAKKAGLYYAKDEL